MWKWYLWQDMWPSLRFSFWKLCCAGHRYRSAALYYIHGVNLTAHCVLLETHSRGNTAVTLMPERCEAMPTTSKLVRRLFDHLGAIRAIKWTQMGERSVGGKAETWAWLAMADVLSAIALPQAQACGYVVAAGKFFWTVEQILMHHSSKGG